MAVQVSYNKAFMFLLQENIESPDTLMRWYCYATAAGCSLRCTPK